MALFSLLLEYGFNFDVAHVNYHLRKESDDEQLLVLKNMVNVFDNDNLHINLCLFEIGQDGKAINTMEENLYSFNDLIAILNSGSKSK